MLLIFPYFYVRTVDVPPSSLNFFACENELLANRQLTTSKLMKTETTSAPDVPALTQSMSLAQSDLLALRSAFGEGGSDLSDRSDSVQPSPTKSNRIQPPPPTPGKETVKFLAIFD